MENLTIKQLQDLGPFINVHFPDVGSLEKAKEILKGVGIDGELQQIKNTSPDGSTHETLEYNPDYKTRIAASFNYIDKEQSE